VGTRDEISEYRVFPVDGGIDAERGGGERGGDGVIGEIVALAAARRASLDVSASEALVSDALVLEAMVLEASVFDAVVLDALVLDALAASAASRRAFAALVSTPGVPGVLGQVFLGGMILLAPSLIERLGDEHRVEYQTGWNTKYAKPKERR
jgi:hypothetical protein